jgi:signal transduction histidine kinase
VRDISSHSIRPAGRHLLTIGRELIHDPYAAVVELVKNAYDADSKDVHIVFRGELERSRYSIDIRDRGHGMSKETVVNAWLVPSTRHKLHSRRSPGGRTMQGRKGVGRYASSILGNDLLLQTTDPSGEQTTVCLLWSDFERAEYLHDVEVLVETNRTQASPGTLLHITGDQTMVAAWDREQFRRLRFELKKLMSPFNLSPEQEFQVRLTIKDFPGCEDIDEIVKPFPIFDFFDYRIAGIVRSDGTGSLTYSNRKSGDPEESFGFQLGRTGTGCGEVELDIRVYDRDKESIDELIKRGLHEESGNYLGKNAARAVLNDYNGIGVYRHGFRIRPLGDPEFDWLVLNKRRVQNPSIRLGTDQVIGYVQIQLEEQSGLIEKSARDGLKDNEAFHNLQHVAIEVIRQLEERRFVYRRAAGLSKKAPSARSALSKLLSFDKLKKSVELTLDEGGVDKKIKAEIISAIESEQEDKTKIVEEIAEIVAIYQGQATLGKIINVILHEGRKPLNYFKNQILNLNHWNSEFTRTKKAEVADRLVSIADGLQQNADIFVKLFERLDPLATARRQSRKPINLKNAIREAFAVFEQDFQRKSIELQIEGPNDLKISASTQDMYAIFTNLADNSIFWMDQANSPQKRIQVTIQADGEGLDFIDYKDTGPGIDPKNIESQIIFEPHFSTKPHGTGLGLAIAGESASRNDLELKAFDSKGGAYFRLQPKEEVAQ